MKLTFAKNTLAAAEVDAAVYFIDSFERVADKELKALDTATNGAVTKILETGEFGGKAGQLAVLYRPEGYRAGRVILAGLGQGKKPEADAFRRAMGDLSRFKALTCCRSAAVSFGSLGDPACYQAAMEGYLLGGFKLLEYKTDKDQTDSSSIDEFMFVADNKSSLTRIEKAVRRGEIIAEGQLLARRLTFTPANDLTPVRYADMAQELARKHKFSCRVLDEDAIRKEKMGALLAVTKGSEEPPRFLVLRHNGGPKNQQPIVLVGKGITFDSGGISLKAALNMHEMKQDMAGSAAVLATLVTVARLGVPRNVVGLIPTCENLPSGHATRPGDIIRSRKGKTVEIINTDAEGRLILADALDYANKFDPQAVIDIATLTGAALYILGYAAAPIVGNNSILADRVRDAADRTAERVWELPLWDDFREQMKSPIADLVNSGGKPAATITAAAFLENFIGDWPWLHIDMAYVDLEPKGTSYVPKGATGYGVRLLTELLVNWKKL